MNNELIFAKREAYLTLWPRKDLLSTVEGMQKLQPKSLTMKYCQTIIDETGGSFLDFQKFLYRGSSRKTARFKNTFENGYVTQKN